MRVSALPLYFCVLLSHSAGELDIEVLILDGANYSAPKFIETISEFAPVLMENNTEIPLLLSKPTVEQVAFVNVVMCVNGTCYKEADLPPPPSPPVALETPGPDVAVIAGVSSAVSVLLITVLCCVLTRRRRTLAALGGERLQRVVIRELIDLPPHLSCHLVKTGSKHTRGFRAV